ncbi:MAG TPA: sugar phosphate nucleotidyltransferase [Methanothrix sp.]|nr:sugar phosphate nucleotidyltransferase [Methanothrix sp.]HRW82190.1 sugar phosphate nucleotidyltransferase [Methanothrix sp.]
MRQAIVLAAGEGRRLRPLTATLPKAMLPVGGKPILENILERAKEAGVEKFVIVVGHKKEKIIDHFGDGSDLDVAIEYVVQDEGLGTGRALLSAEELAEDRFLVMNGDVLCDAASLERMVEEGGPAVATARVEDPDPERDWILKIADGFLKTVDGKERAPSSALIFAGISLLDRRIFDALRAVIPSSDEGRRELDLMEGVLSLLADGVQIRAVEVESWIEIVLPWDILEANETVPPESRGVLGEVDGGATLAGEVAVGKGTVIRSGSYLEGPVVIGEGCEIGPNSLIRGPSSLGDGVRVGTGAVIERSVIMEGTEVSHLCYVGDSVVGPGCSLGVGTIVANRRHDGSEVVSYAEGKRAETDRRTLGAVLGEEAKTGVGTLVYPGTVIEAGRWGRPGEVLWGRVEAERGEDGMAEEEHSPDKAGAEDGVGRPTDEREAEEKAGAEKENDKTSAAGNIGNRPGDIDGKKEEPTGL